jgi:hypothetical protein
MNYRLFDMRSTKLVSDFDFVPEWMENKQKDVCETCLYRWYRIDLDIARVCRRGLPAVRDAVPACELGKCLIEEEIKRLLNKEELIRTKEAGKWKQ